MKSKKLELCGIFAARQSLKTKARAYLDRIAYYYTFSLCTLRRWGATPDPGEAPPMAGFNIKSEVA
jgi:hypothetical protein